MHTFSFYNFTSTCEQQNIEKIIKTMSLVKYVGRTTDFRGKSLWEILGNLKNYGVGRVVGK